jgi:hypothetical protein
MMATEWKYKEFSLLGSAHLPYYLMCFRGGVDPDIKDKPLVLSCREMLSVGDTVAYMDGKKTSAGFSELYPHAPTVFVYNGVYYCDEDDTEYAVWHLMDEETEEELALLPFAEFGKIFYAHAILKTESEAGISLVYTNKAGAGRIIETERYYKSHASIPEELKKIYGVER